jgi:hypothetical protein
MKNEIRTVRLENGYGFTDYSAEDDSYRRMGYEDGYYKVRMRQALARTCWQLVTFLDPQAGNLGTPM